MLKTKYILIATLITLASSCKPTQSITNPASEVAETTIPKPTSQKPVSATSTSVPQSPPSKPVEPKDQPITKT